MPLVNVELVRMGRRDWDMALALEKHLCCFSSPRPLLGTQLVLRDPTATIAATTCQHAQDMANSDKIEMIRPISYSIAD